MFHSPLSSLPSDRKSGCILKLHRLITGLFLQFFSALLIASPSESLDTIKNVAENHLQHQLNTQGMKNVKITMGRLDNRLKLRACSTSLEAFLPKGAKLIGNTSIGVRCPGVHPWKIYISAQIAQFSETMVAAKLIRHDEIIDRSHLKQVRMDISRQSFDYYTSFEQVLGKRSRQTIHADQTLRSSMFNSQRLITKGQKVTITSGQHGIHISMTGIALTNGKLGDRIRVKNTQSSREIEGIIQSNGTVFIN